MKTLTEATSAFGGIYQNQKTLILWVQGRTNYHAFNSSLTRSMLQSRSADRLAMECRQVPSCSSHRSFSIYIFKSTRHRGNSSSLNIETIPSKTHLRYKIKKLKYLHLFSISITISIYIWWIYINRNKKSYLEMMGASRHYT